MAINKVLVVDDSPVDLANIQNIVTDAGCMVLTASNGKEAIDKAKAEKPDLVFLDIIMPDQDGFGTCREL
ncbi:MAG: response regulator, partial [Candidatus Tectomicrobia bacterium]|nr:response regulator [Candidatus Tectomicrobia bacterium]